MAERDDSMPTVVEYTIQGQDKIQMCSTLIMAGSYKEHQSTMTLFSDITILHVKLFQLPSSHLSKVDEGEKPVWRYRLPDHYRTVILYVRSGCIEISGTRIPPHHTVYLSQTGNDLVISLGSHSPTIVSSDMIKDSEPQIGADFIVLAGEPLDGEPVVAEGSFVMNSYDEIRKAFQDYQMGAFGLPWKETLSDDEWRVHVDKYGSKK
jgi:redox-sensitive bicupin YhaK (pirin superfamily)